jgi:hypothetical protein
MKRHYAGREDEMPKTLAGFRRARRADDLSPAFKKWRYRERDKKQGNGKSNENLKNVLTNRGRNGIMIEPETEVQIEVDIATPCLINKQTNEVVKTEMKVVPQSYAKEIDKSGEYKFKWQKIVEDHSNAKLAILTVAGNDRIEGIVAYEEVKSDNAYIVHNIEKSTHNRGDKGQYAGVAKHLFAYVSKIALEEGCDCIEFKAKSSLIDYYKKTLFAYQVYGQIMCMEKEQMQKLVDIYYSEDNNEEE